MTSQRVRHIPGCPDAQRTPDWQDCSFCQFGGTVRIRNSTRIRALLEAREELRRVEQRGFNRAHQEWRKHSS